ncbi:LAFA_0C03950g1_1 [Lachancea sp. 'fantastica']|nr:LAFA_0C03950g1_1 [Lachancea sp. 'fantastica']
MVTGDSRLTPKVLELVSDVVRDITTSLTEPLTELVDMLTESLMYPRGSRKSLMNILCRTDEEIKNFESADFVSQDLGSVCLLDAVHTAKLIGKLNGLSKGREYPSTQSAMLEELHGALVNLLKQLSGQIEINSHLCFYKDLLRENVVHFRHAFDALQNLDSLSSALMKTAADLRLSESAAVLKFDAKTAESMRSFTVTNAKWHDQLLLGSQALKEYLVLQDHNIDTLSSDPQNDLYKEAAVVVRSPVFRNYVQARKARLKITQRRVF